LEGSSLGGYVADGEGGHNLKVGEVVRP
jgi:hypothetical protein